MTAPDTEREMKLRECSRHECDARGEAMICDGCGSTLTIAAILHDHGPQSIACCPERKMVPARWYWERALRRPTPLHADDDELVAALRHWASRLKYGPDQAWLEDAADRIQQLSGGATAQG